MKEREREKDERGIERENTNTHTHLTKIPSVHTMVYWTNTQRYTHRLMHNNTLFMVQKHSSMCGIMD